MSSDPIEVLRDMKEMMRLDDYERSALDAAIASLSAPQPPAEAQPAARFTPSDADRHRCGNCGQRIADHVPDEEGARCKREAIVGKAPQQASAPVGVDDIIEAFDEISGLCRHLRQGGPAPEDLNGLSGALDEAIGIAGDMLAALAQQPAAVDEATRRDAERYRYLRRPEAWKENHIAERGASAIFIGDGRRGEAKDGEALDAAIDRILAGQQQGGEL